MMYKRVLFCVCAAALCVLAEGREARAQKVDIGAQFSLIRLRDLGTTNGGFGGRITYNATDNFAFDAEFNYFPQDGTLFLEGGRKTQGFFGLKTGVRSGSAGIYGKIRPGFMRFSRDFDGLPNGRTEFALDVGGVIEFYPSGRAIVRFDVGDTIIRFGAQNTLVGPISSFTSHNLQFSVGVGVRF